MAEHKGPETDTLFGLLILRTLLKGEPVPEGSSVGHELALRNISPELRGRLQRITDASPAMKHDLEELAIELFDEGRDVGNDEGYDEGHRDAIKGIAEG